MQGDKNRQILIVVGLVVVSFIVAAVLNMTGFKSVHVEPSRQATGASAGGNAGHAPRPAH
jgi:hypothetical protein